jgi:uncharacterized repeat protein (TIGR03803 family)
MTKLKGWIGIRLVILVAATVSVSSAQDFSTLVNFNGSNGAVPFYGFLVQGVDGYIYGTTLSGGPNFAGTVIKINAKGQVTTLYSFCSRTNCTDGGYPYAGLVQGTDGTFYGTTSEGGTNNAGTVFRITTQGKLTTLYSFCSQTNCTDGGNPEADLVQGIDGNLYGTTVGDGRSEGRGTVFRITETGVLTTVYRFCSQENCSDGEFPLGVLVQGYNGNFYGTTSSGGNESSSCGGCGTVFEISPAGSLTTLYTFCSDTPCMDGGQPYAGLAQANNGNFYGTTEVGGTNCPSEGGCGTVFEITPSGHLTTIYNFCSQANCDDGSFPEAGLVQATDGGFYGTTYAGGTNASGVIFKITTEDQQTVLYNLCSQTACTDGSFPVAGLLQDTNGVFYGTTNRGGIDDAGTVYSLSLGLGRFVRTLPPAGKVGSEVGILGTDLTGATTVTFNSVAAKFTVRSPSLILAHVPTGATTGYVTVTTPSGVLKSNVPFHLIP